MTDTKSYLGNLNMIVKIIIFDLDGTLINSANSILNSLQVAFNEVGISPIQPLTSDLVGPPLQDIISKLLCASDVNSMPNIAAAFKRHYDETGYVYAKAYDGISVVLESLKTMQLKLFIATNKRSIPTKKIIGLTGWNSFFSGIYSLDTFHPALPNKSILLENILYSLNISSKEVIYIGDRAEDYDAARSVGCNFILAEWGYINNFNGRSCSVRIKSPDMLLDTLERNFF